MRRVTDTTQIDRNAARSNDEDFEVWMLLDHAHFAISRARELELAQYGITTEQAAVLHTLAVKGGSATIHDISNITMRQHNSVSTLVRRMAKQDLLTKEKSSGDKKHNISMTERGRSTYENVARVSIQMAFSVLSQEEKQTLASYLKRLTDKGRTMLGIDRRLPFLPSEPAR